MPQRRSVPRTIAALSVFTLALVAALPASGSTCTLTANNCDWEATVTTSRLQIGGDGSLGSRGTVDGHGTLSDGTIAEAVYQFTFDRSTARLTLIVTNTTKTEAHLTGVFFNGTAAVSGLTLISHTGTLSWTAAFDRDRADGIVDNAPWLDSLHGEGFGLFHAFLSNHPSLSTGTVDGVPKNEIAPGHSVTFVFQVSGDLVRISACSFTSNGSVIPAGDKIVDGSARFRDGDNGGAGVIETCHPDSLLVTFGAFDAYGADGQVTALWDTAAEVDNAGFRVLRTDVRAHTTVALNSNLVPAQGSPTSGYAYAYVDTTAVNGRKYRYQVEDWDLGGKNTIHAGKEIVPNPSRPSVRLLEPGYDAALKSDTRLKWESDGRQSSVVEISADAGFPTTATLQLRTAGRMARSLTGREADLVRAMGAAGEGGVYWRVTSRDGRGQSSRSQTYFLSTTN
ncbi:MAG: hypothetical protein HY049_06410 [Acidobacteria bacterium]|nr:hypothetical protein [Acidobacteriota bacterium]